MSPVIGFSRARAGAPPAGLQYVYGTQTSEDPPTFSSNLWTTTALGVSGAASGDLLEVKGVLRSTGGRTVLEVDIWGLDATLHYATQTGQSQIAFIATVPWVSGASGVVTVLGEDGIVAQEAAVSLALVKSAVIGDVGGDFGSAKQNLVLDRNTTPGGIASAVCLGRNADTFNFPELGTPDHQSAINGGQNFFAVAHAAVPAGSPTSIRANLDAAPTFSSGASIIYEAA